MQRSMCLDEMVALEDHMEEVVVLDVLDPVCVYTFISGQSISGQSIRNKNVDNR